jgi:ElaB/YqjD/DUF883 family membrane-anchored ribosome-binding protein
MSENLEKQIDDWQQRAKKLIDRIGESSKETARNLRKEYENLEKQGKDLVDKANKRANEAQQNVREQWKVNSEKADKVRKDLQQAWKHLTETPTEEKPPQEATE